MKLSWKITYILIITAFLPMLLLVGLIFFLSKETLLSVAKTNKADAIREISSSVDIFLHERSMDIAVFAQRTLVVYPLENDQSASSSAKVLQINYSQLKMDYWQKILTVDIDGQVVDSSDSQFIRSSLSGSELIIFEKTINQNKVITEFIIDHNLKNKYLVFAAPIKSNQAEKVIGVVMGYLPWESFINLLNTIPTPVVIVNNDGNLIANNRQGEEFSKNFDKQKKIFHLIKDELPGSKTADSIVVDNQLVTYIEEAGYDDYLGHKWIFLTQTSIDQATNAARRAVLQVGTAIILVFIVMVLLANHLLNSIISQPLAKLGQEVRKISQGEKDIHLPVHSHDEIGELARAFNRMIDKIQDSQNDVEQQVQEKTKQVLEQKHNLDNQQKALLNILEDVAAEKETTRELAEDLKKFQLAVANSSEHTIITDAEGKIIFANQAASKITGYQAEEMIGKKAGTAEMWGGQMPKSFYEKMWHKVKQQKQTFTGEFNNHRKNGEKYIAEASISPILDEKGEVKYFVAIERDITHAKEVDRMKTEFISLASHQLRTPLSAMKWFLEMLLNGDAGKLSKQQTEFVQNIDISNERMIALVNSLLNISRIESGRIIIDPKPTDLGKLVAEVAKELEQKIKEKKIDFVISCNQRLPLINLDAKLISEVFKNLLTNAIKYSPAESEIMVLISSKGKEVIAQVSDNGYGIPAAEQDKVFQRFFRATNVAKLETDGTGLGLYLAKAIIESSRGKIWFKSQEGKGTTFWISLPLTGMKSKPGEVSLNS